VSDLADRIEIMRQKKQKSRDSDRVAKALDQEWLNKERDKKRVEMRLKFPFTAAVVDEFRAQGVSVRVLAVEKVVDDE